MSGNTKRNIVVATMAVLVCAAVGLNWKYSTQEALQQAEETGNQGEFLGFSTSGICTRRTQSHFLSRNAVSYTHLISTIFDWSDK